MLGTGTRQMGTAVEPDTTDILTELVQAAVTTVPGAVYSGISLLDTRTTLSTRAATHALVDQCDQWQGELGEGPCLDACWQHPTVLVRDLARQTRWPHFTARATGHGLGSLLSVRLGTELGLGTLTLYAPYGEHFDDAPIPGRGIRHPHRHNPRRPRSREPTSPGVA